MRVGSGLLAFLTFFLDCSYAFAQGSSSLEELTVAIGGEQLPQAKRLADGILKSGSAAERQAATLAYGRILLAAGDTKQAYGYLSQLRKLNLEENGGRLYVDVYQAWLDALAGKEKEAITRLEQILNDGLSSPATVEASEVLARIHLSKGRMEHARQAIDFGLQFAKYHGMKLPHLDQLLNRRLSETKPKPQVDPAEALFRQAEYMRGQKKFSEAGALYQRIFREFGDSTWGHPAGHRLGTCLLELGKPSEAFAWWEKEFVAPDPAGPYRGQALLEMADYQLERQLDPQAAQRTLSHMELALTQGASHATWLAIRYSLYLRMGLLAYLKNDLPEAEAWFQKTRPFAQKEKVVRAQGQELANLPPNRIERLIAACQSKEVLTPASARQGDEKVSLILLIGDLYQHGQEFQKSVEFYDRVLGLESGLKPAMSQTAHAFYRRIQCHWEANEMEAVVKLSHLFTSRFPQHEKSADILMHCGVAHFSALKQETEALACFDRVQSAYPQSVEAKTALWHLATIHRWQGRPQLAIGYYEQYKRRFPKEPAVDYINEVLVELRGSSKTESVRNN